jgi:hypothetical protein
LKSPFILFESPTKCPDFELNSPECLFAAAAAAAAIGDCGGGENFFTTTSSRAAAAARFDTQTPIFPPFINPTKHKKVIAFYQLKGFTFYLFLATNFAFGLLIFYGI